MLAPLRGLESGATEGIIHLKFNFCFRNGWDYKCIESGHFTCDLVGDIYLPEEAAESRAILDLPPNPHRKVELRATRGIVHPPNSTLFLKWVGV